MLGGVNAVALITGGSRGIGRGIALELAKLGWDLALNYASNQPAAEQTAGDCASAARAAGRTVCCETFKGDISEKSAREALLAFVKARFGRLDLLVNNAGVAPRSRMDLLETTEESFDRVFQVNVKGPYFLTQLAARWMLEQVARGLCEARGKPKIITISSISAYAASTNRGEYCVAKAALSMLTPLYASRLAEHGINVYEIRPGIIATDMTEPVKEKYRPPHRRWPDSHCALGHASRCRLGGRRHCPGFAPL